MTTYTIQPINTGTIVVDKGEYVTRGQDVGVEVDIPSLAWYVTDGQRRILIDTGMCESPLADMHHAGSRQDPGQAIHARLEAMEIEPASIDTILFTHLHWDHCHNLDQFPDAKLYVSAVELDFARNPHPLYDKSYEHERLGLQAPFVGREFTTISGDTEIFDGISMFPTPGHSPGHCSVAVATTEGVYVVAGDAVFAYANLQPASTTLKFTLMGRVMDVLTAWRSIDDIVQRGAVVLPGHDFAVLDQQIYP